MVCEAKAHESRVSLGNLVEITEGKECGESETNMRGKDEGRDQG